MCIRAHFGEVISVCLSIETFWFENADGFLVNFDVNVVWPEDAVSL